MAPTAIIMSIEPHPSVSITPRLRLWQLISPTLPVGAFAYSQGLEYAIYRNWVRNSEDTLNWIQGVTEHALCATDVPALHRLYLAWQDNDKPRLDYWNAWLLACRNTQELRHEDVNTGKALARLLNSLQLAEAGPWLQRRDTTYLCMLALAASRWGIPLDDIAQGFLWSWSENQVTTAMKLVPLGQTEGQTLLSQLMKTLPASAAHGLTLNDEDMGYGAPGQTLASSWHETQYSRLFRS